MILFNYEKVYLEKLALSSGRLAPVRILFWLGFLSLFFSCQSENLDPKPPAGDIYFPPRGSSVWETVTPEELGWELGTVSELASLLEENGTRAFLILKDGKIAFEYYFGRRLAVNQPFVRESNWYWASAGKTLTAATVGVAQHEGFLTIDQKTLDLRIPG